MSLRRLARVLFVGRKRLLFAVRRLPASLFGRGSAARVAGAGRAGSAGVLGRKGRVKSYLARRGRLWKMTAALVSVLLAVFLWSAAVVYEYGGRTSEAEADAAIVLGAAVWTRRPSPVFRERINHAVELYKTRRVRKLILTGGQGAVDEPAESVAARTYAVQRGVPASDVYVERLSHNTYENLQQASRIVAAQRIRRVVIVTDPLHMKRAVSMARDLGLDAHPSPTPTTRYQSARSQLTLLLEETYLYLGYRLGRLVF